MNIDNYSRKQTIIDQHPDHFDNLPKHYKPKKKPHLEGRKLYTKETIPINLFNYQTEDFHCQNAGLKNNTIFEPDKLQYKGSKNAYEHFNNSLLELTGGVPLPIEMSKPIRQFCDLSGKFNTYRNPERSILKQLEKKNKKKKCVTFEKKTTTLFF